MREVIDEVMRCLEEGLPIPPLSDEACASFVRPPHGGWAAVLRQAAADAICAENFAKNYTGGRVVTSWHPDAVGLVPVGAEDMEKHHAYVASFLTAAEAALPWLPTLLTASNALLLVAPGVCAFKVSSVPDEHQIPELLHLTHFLPWVTDREAANPN